MDVAGLATWRDAALILLAVEALLGGLLLAAALYWILRRLGLLLERIRPLLFQARMVAWRTREGTGRAMSIVAAPFIWLQSTVHGLIRALDVLDWR
jgi:hypothetical protein